MLTDSAAPDFASADSTVREMVNARRFPHNLPPAWMNVLKSEVNQSYFQNLIEFLRSEYQRGSCIFPAQDRILRALQLLDLPDVRVVILGQDPYHGPRQATGLSFAVPNDMAPKPPSLLNIFKEIEQDCAQTVDRKSSELTSWVNHGVLLLNTVLTVRAGQAFSHRDKGWERFTDTIIRTLSAREEPLIFLLWGSPAQAKASLIDAEKHFILRAPHPSPLSAHRGFLGCRHFSKANQLLREKPRRSEIPWWITQ